MDRGCVQCETRLLLSKHKIACRVAAASHDTTSHARVSWSWIGKVILRETLSLGCM